MTTVYPDTRYPTLLESAPCAYRRVISGSTASGMASQTNHYIGVRGRRAVHKQWSITTDPDSTGAGGFAPYQGHIWQSPEAVQHTYRLWWTSGYFANRIVVTFQYQAGTTTLTTAKPDVEVLAYLYKKNGPIIDAPDAASAACRWSIDEGTISLAAAEGYNDGTNERTQWPLLIATTGDRQPPSPLSTPYPNSPRPLICPASNRGDELEVRLVTKYVRILAADVWEFAEESMTT